MLQSSVLVWYFSMRCFFNFCEVIRRVYELHWRRAHLLEQVLEGLGVEQAKIKEGTGFQPITPASQLRHIRATG